MMRYLMRLKRKEDPMIIHIYMKAVSKERPRVGRSGHIYTPPRTQKFEKTIAEAAKTLRREPYTCPVKVCVGIYEPVPKSYPKWKKLGAELGMLSPPVGDLDNKVKAITDGLNGIAYLDDRQINYIIATRTYGDEHTIHIQVERNGLSLGEVERYVKSNNVKGGT